MKATIVERLPNLIKKSTLVSLINPVDVIKMLENESLGEKVAFCAKISLDDPITK